MVKQAQQSSYKEQKYVTLKLLSYIEQKQVNLKDLKTVCDLASDSDVNVKFAPGWEQHVG